MQRFRAFGGRRYEFWFSPPYMLSHIFIRDRAELISQVATSIAGVYVFPERTLVQLADSVTSLDQLDADEGAKRTTWRNAAILWDNNLSGIKALTGSIKRQGLFRFANDPVKKRLFTKLKVGGRSRQDIYDHGQSARDAWQEAEPGWLVEGNQQLSAFSSSLAGALALKGTHGTKLTAWRKSAAARNNKARGVNTESVAWYADATRKCKAGTTEGDLIRSTVPVTTRPTPAVGQAVISNVMVSGQDVHFDFTAPHGTRFTVYHKAPGSPVFLVVVTETREKSITLHDLAEGEHQFKVVGINSDGEGPESAVTTVQVAEEAVA